MGNALPCFRPPGSEEGLHQVTTLSSVFWAWRTRVTLASMHSALVGSREANCFRRGARLPTIALTTHRTERRLAEIWQWPAKLEFRGSGEHHP